MANFTAYVSAGLAEMCVQGGFIVVVSSVSWTTLGVAGGMMQKFLAEHWRTCNIVMGLALLWCVADSQVKELRILLTSRRMLVQVLRRCVCMEGL